jgi:hypothetical protein
MTVHSGTKRTATHQRPSLASAQLQQWSCDAPPHEVSWNMQRRSQARGKKTDATSVCYFVERDRGEFEHHRASHPRKSINAAI